MNDVVFEPRKTLLNSFASRHQGDGEKCRHSENAYWKIVKFLLVYINRMSDWIPMYVQRSPSIVYCYFIDFVVCIFSEFLARLQHIFTERTLEMVMGVKQQWVILCFLHLIACLLQCTMNSILFLVIHQSVSFNFPILYSIVREHTLILIISIHVGIGLFVATTDK